MKIKIITIVPKVVEWKWFKDLSLNQDKIVLYMGTSERKTHVFIEFNQETAEISRMFEYSHCNEVFSFFKEVEAPKWFQISPS